MAGEVGDTDWSKPVKLFQGQTAWARNLGQGEEEGREKRISRWQMTNKYPLLSSYERDIIPPISWRRKLMIRASKKQDGVLCWGRECSLERRSGLPLWVSYSRNPCVHTCRTRHTQSSHFFPQIHSGKQRLQMEMRLFFAPRIGKGE